MYAPRPNEGHVSNFGVSFIGSELQNNHPKTVVETAVCMEIIPPESLLSDLNPAHDDTFELIGACDL